MLFSGGLRVFRILLLSVKRPKCFKEIIKCSTSVYYLKKTNKLFCFEKNTNFNKNHTSGRKKFTKSKEIE